MNQLRQIARRFLPDPIRKPLGYAAGCFHAVVIRWLQGALFDLRGGHFRADGCTFAIPKDLTSRAYRACFLDGSYEAEERELVRAFVQPTDTVLEAGACLGIVSCVTNKLLRDKTRHVVVEGNPFCLPTLHRNRQINQCGFLVENCAVSNQPEVTFFLHPVYIVGGTYQRQTAREVRVPGRSLKDLTERYGPFSVLIMDIEGAERDILEAHPEVLRQFRLVIIELHDWAIGAEGAGRCRQILAQAGLQRAGTANLTEAWQRPVSPS